MKELYTMVFSDQLSIILNVISQVIIVILGIVAVSLARKSIKKTGIETDSLINEGIEKIVSNAVSYTNQVLADDLKKVNGGSLTEEEKNKVFNITKKAIQICLNTEQINFLTKKYGDIDSGLDVLIEAYVNYSSNKNITTNDVSSVELEQIEPTTESMEDKVAENE